MKANNTNNANQKNETKKEEKPKAKVYCRRYERIKQIGEGTFGRVYLSYDRKKKNKTLKELWESGVTDIPLLALKRTKNNENMNKQGIDFTFLREINIMKEVTHENVINLLDVFFEDDSFFTVMDNMLYDLRLLIQNFFNYYDLSDIKCILYQILKGLNFLHKSWILHRDLTPANMLLDKDGTIKISDLGFAKYFGSPDRLQTKGIVTIAYRAPELLFGANSYGPKVDIWSVGCIMAELFYGSPIFPGQSDIDQLIKIFQVLGTPSVKSMKKNKIKIKLKEENWPNCTKLEGYVQFENFKGVSFKELIYDIPDNALDLLNKMLVLDPAKRIDTEIALQHEFFKDVKPKEECNYVKLYAANKRESINSIIKDYIS